MSAKTLALFEEVIMCQIANLGQQIYQQTPVGESRHRYIDAIERMLRYLNVFDEIVSRGDPLHEPATGSEQQPRLPQQQERTDPARLRYPGLHIYEYRQPGEE